MSLNALGLGFMFTATDLASGVMQNIKNNFHGLEDAAGRNVANLDKMVAGLGAGLTATAAGIGGLAASFNAAKSAGDLETALTRIQNKAHGSAEEMAKMKDFALNKAKALGAGPLEAAAGMDQLAQAGLKTNEILRRMPGVMKLAELGEMSVGDAADLSSQAMNAFAIKSERFTEALDQMQSAADGFAMSTSDLTIGLARMIPGATLFKSASLTDVLAMFGMVNDVLQSKTQSATGISYMLKELADPKTIAALHQMGVEVDNGRGSFRDFDQILAQLAPHVDAMGEISQSSLLAKIFGGDALKAITALTKKMKAGYTDQAGAIHYGVEAVQKAIEDRKKSAGLLDAGSAALLEKFNGSLKRMDASASSLVTKIGEPFMKIWKPQVEAAIKALDKFSESLDKVDKKTLQLIAQTLTAGAALLTMLGTVGILRAAWPLVARGADLLRIAIVGLGKATLIASWEMWPVTLTLLGIAAIVYAVRKNLGGLGDAWDRVTGSVDGSQSTWTTLSNVMSTIWDALADGWDWAMTNFAGWFYLIRRWIELLVQSFDSLAESLNFKGAGDMFVSVLKVIGGAIGIIAVAAAALIGVLTGLVAIIVEVVAYAINWVVDVFKEFISMIEEAGKMWRQFVTFLGGAPERAQRAAYGEPQKPAPEPVAPKPKVTAVAVPAAVAEQMNAMPPADLDEGALLGRFRAKPAGAAQASFFEGVMPSQMELIDYDKMAAACSRVSVNAYLDGQKMNEWWNRRMEDSRNRSSEPRR